jgi:glycosyltransferase involved in cell wall biosynthesis
VKDGVTGLLVPAGDHEALAARTLQVWSDAGLRRRLSEAGRAHALRHYTAEMMDRRYLALYERIVRERRAPLSRSR